MKILIYNIAYGTGLDGSIWHYFLRGWRYLWNSQSTIKNITQFIEQQEVDVACLIEVDEGSFRNRFKKQSRQMNDTLNFSSIDSRRKYKPRSLPCYLPVLNKQHNVILSKKPATFKAHYFEQGMKKLIQETIIDHLSVFTVHLALFSQKIRKKQLEQMGNIIENCSRPHIICGDFNLMNGLHELTDFAEKYQLKVIQSLPTFPAYKPKKSLDIILSSSDVEIDNAQVEDVCLSDHLPVWVKINN